MNPFFNAMGGNKQPNMMQQFQQFMNQMKGKDPNAVIQDMMQSGKITPGPIQPGPHAGTAGCRACLRGWRESESNHFNQLLNQFKPFNQIRGHGFEINLQRRLHHESFF